MWQPALPPLPMWQVQGDTTSKTQKKADADLLKLKAVAMATKALKASEVDGAPTVAFRFGAHIR